ncbi:MAG TPA: Gfo/Idh/MocA family oxidoreductase, partial [Terriglobales bacterium]|nr:Gfo/Idh/MocA family oxidoreductase [Terriglobales bacterium]
MVRFGILGFGLHAVRRLMPGFARAKACRVTALSRRDLAKARASAKEFDIPLAFDSGAELCRSPEVDAVFVTTPNALHVQDVLTAVEAGKPVLCEKPMGMNADECRQMVEAARAAKVLLGVAQVFRFENSTARLRERIAAGQIGKPIFARSEFSYSATHHKRQWIYDRKLAGGGPIMDVGVHCVDALRYILQDEVDCVFARALSDERSGGVEAASTMNLEFSQGTMGTVLVSMRADYRTPIEFVGEGGVLRADDGLNVERPITLELRRDGKVVESEVVANLDAYARQVDAFAAAVRGEAAFPVPAEEGW